MSWHCQLDVHSSSPLGRAEPLQCLERQQFQGPVPCDMTHGTWDWRNSFPPTPVSHLEQPPRDQTVGIVNSLSGSFCETGRVVDVEDCLRWGRSMWDVTSTGSSTVKDLLWCSTWVLLPAVHMQGYGVELLMMGSQWIW